MSLRAHHLDTVAGKLRGKDFQLVSALNEKSPKGEKLGYLTAMVYLAPAAIAGGKTLCPHSTAACREGCLFTAGRGKTPRVHNARVRRAQWYLNDRDSFFDQLIGELAQIQAVADRHGMIMAIRLNGTSDIAFERETFEDGRTLFDLFERAKFYDFSRTPLHHRRVPPGWHLTFSLADDPVEVALAHLKRGQNVAVVIPEEEKRPHESWFMLGDIQVTAIDGDDTDLRFLDPTPSLIQLRPKGRLRSGHSPMVRRGLIDQLIRINRDVA